MFALQYNIFTLIEDGIIDSDGGARRRDGKVRWLRVAASTTLNMPISIQNYQNRFRFNPMKLVSILDGLGPDDDRSDVGALSVSILSTMPAMLDRLIEDIHLNGGDKITCIVADMIMGGYGHWKLGVS
ncbi:hypothetical protein HKD37_01G001085 [Glycine soja]